MNFKEVFFSFRFIKVNTFVQNLLFFDISIIVNVIFSYFILKILIISPIYQQKISFDFKKTLLSLICSNLLFIQTIFVKNNLVHLFTNLNNHIIFNV